MDIGQALQSCDRLAKAHSSTFYLGSGLFPKEKRQAVRVIYAACRTGDDAVDEAANPREAQRRLAAWWQGIERSFEGAPQANPVEVGLAWALGRHAIPFEAFAELHLGFLSDLDFKPLQSLDDLMLYCRRVAGVVGWLVTPIAGYRGGDKTLASALALGQAMQLTNILRDVGEDLDNGRCYLPAELLDKHEVKLSDLKAGRVEDNYIMLLEELADIAYGLYRQGWQGIPMLHSPGSMAVGVAALNYEAILRKLRQNRYNNLTRRAHLKPLERLILIPQAAAGVYGRCPVPGRLQVP